MQDQFEEKVDLMNKDGHNVWSFVEYFMFAIDTYVNWEWILLSLTPVGSATTL